MNPLEQSLVEILRQDCPDLRAVYLFGSVAKGQSGPESDLDIAAVGLPAGNRFDLATRLSLAAGRDVDLIDLHAASTILQKEILTGGRRLWAASEIEADSYELFIMASYQKLCAERAAIIEAGIQAGRFYYP